MDQLRHVASQFEDSSGIPGRKAPQVFRRTPVQYSMPAAKKKSMSSSMDKQVFRRTTVHNIYYASSSQKNHELEYGQNEHQNNITTQKCNNKCLQHPDTKLDTLQLLL
jgi:hypothetical protein